MKHPDTIILGAGMAGLAAARTLSRAGVRTLILEARPRIGGRVWTIDDPHSPHPIEMGAEFIHGRPDATFDLIREANLIPYDLPFCQRFRRAGKLEALSAFDDQIKKAMSGLARLKGKDISFAEYLRTYRRGRSLAEARRMALDFVQGFDAADPERISARSLAKEQEGVGNFDDEKQFRLLGGYRPLVNFLFQSLDPKRSKLLLKHAATHIRWASGSVEVTAQSTPSRARSSRLDASMPHASMPSSTQILRSSRLIITLPLGILQRPPESPGAIRFVPDITHHREAMAHLASGPIIKVLALFKSIFWETAESARIAGATGGEEKLKDAVFLHDMSAPIPVWWTQRPLRIPLLTGWVGGPRAAALSSGYPAAPRRAGLERAAIRSLASLFSRSESWIRSQLVSLHIHDWTADPFAAGAYSYECVGAGKARTRLAQPLASTLFFAGEATDDQGQASTVAGALASGERAANQLLQSVRLRRQKRR